jgi:hypothetical protein
MSSHVGTRETAQFSGGSADQESGALKCVVSLNFASWNQIAGWLRRLAGLQDAA